MLFGSHHLYAALSGTYTIDPSLPASVLNYQNFSSVINDLYSGTRTDGGTPNGSGVSGPVRFVIASGTHTQQLEFYTVVPGASDVNRIEFDGVHPDSCTITFNATSTNARHTIRLESTRYIDFRNLTVQTTGAFGWGIHIIGAGSGNIRISNCVVDITGAGTSATTSAFAGIIANGSTTSVNSGAQMDSLYIDSNVINYGYYGIALFAPFSSTQRDNKVTHNIVNNSYSAGIICQAMENVLIENNRVYAKSSSNGIQLDNATSVAPQQTIVRNNIITSFGGNGLMISGCVSIGNRGLVYNNMIGGAVNGLFASGIWSEYNENFLFCNNAVNLNYGGTYSYAFLSDNDIGIAVYNNIFAITEAFNGLLLFSYDPSSFDSMDHNIFYRKDVSDGKFIYLGSDYDVNSFAGAEGFNMNSSATKPTFVSATDLHIRNSCIKGIPLAFLTEDFDGDPRGLYPTIGADEGNNEQNNIAVNAMVSPAFPVSAGLQDVQIEVQNMGDTAVYSFDISYVLNGGMPVTQSFADTLQPCDTTVITFTGANQALITSTNDFVVYTSMPNGVTDPYADNDTLKLMLLAPLNGAYTIGGVTADFADFASAVASLEQAGISGPVTFTVNPGTYPEQVNLEHDIAGSSPVNTITFEGANAATCIVEYSSIDWTSPHTVKIGANHIRFRNLTIETNGSDNGWGFYISKNNASDIHIKQCVVNINNAQANEGFGNIVLSGAPTFFYEDVFRVDSIEIDSNILRNGYAGIWHMNSQMSPATASTRISIRHNTFENITGYGIFSDKALGLTIHGNTLQMTPEVSMTAMSLSTMWGQLDSTMRLEVTSNKMWGSLSGIELYTAHNHASNPGLIANNTFNSSMGGDPAYGIYAYDGNSINIIHNTISINSLSTYAMSGALVIDNSSDLNIINNHLAASRIGTAGAPVYASDPSAIVSCEGNNFYKPDTSRLVNIGGWYSASTVQGANGLNNVVFSLDPQFTNDTLLTTSNTCLNGVASIVSTDINNNPRSITPDIGAYENVQVANDIAVTGILTPAFPFVAGLQDLRIQVTNRGSNPVSAFQLAYSWNGSAPVTQLWTSGTPLAPCDTISVLFTGANQVNLLAGQQNTLTAYTLLPNNVTDANLYNDTLKKTLLTPLNGTYTIGATAADFGTLQEAADALASRGVSGAVTFRLQSGVYNERVEMYNVTGASPSNTITFTSAADDADSVTLEGTATAMADNYIIQLIDARYFHFHKLTFNTYNAPYNRVINFVNATAFDSVTACKFNAPPTSSTSLASAVICAYNFNGTDLVISGNTINGGSHGVFLQAYDPAYPPHHLVVSNNTISGFNYAGIYVYYSTNSQLNNNIITGSSANNSIGLLCYYGHEYTQIRNNRIEMTTGGAGIQTYYCDGSASASCIVANNEVIVGGNRASYGIRNQYSKFEKIYHNSVLMKSTLGSYAGYFYFNNATAHAGNEVMNNILCNTGNGSAMYVYNPSLSATLQCNYNNLYAPPLNNLVVRGTPAALYNNIYTWRNAYPFDKQSANYYPGFTSATDLTPNATDSSVWSINGRGAHLDSNIIRTDKNGNIRPGSLTAGVPDIGAYEVNPASLPPIATAIPATPVLGTTQSFVFAGDTVVSITWDNFGIAPDYIHVRQYSGEREASLGSTTEHMFFYTGIEIAPGSYSYQAAVKYRQNWLGRMSNETDLVAAGKTPGNFWGLINTGITDSVNNVINTGWLYDPDILLSGGNPNNPLPVKLLSFSGSKQHKDVLLQWSTASELNFDRFVIEKRGTDGKWTVIGTVKGNGSQHSVTAYTFIDRNAFATGNTLYYRLKMLDRDASFDYSNTIVLNEKETATEPIKIYPNPFNNELFLVLARPSSKVSITCYDMKGAEVFTQTREASANEPLRIQLPEAMEKGMYYIKTVSGEEVYVQKMMKQ